MSLEHARPGDDDLSLSLADDLLRGVPAIAEFCGLSVRMTYHLVAQKKLPHVKVGKRVYARRSELIAHFTSARPSNGGSGGAE